MVMDLAIDIDIDMDYGHYSWPEIDSHRGIERTSRK
jgi:hypothetical protein